MRRWEAMPVARVRQAVALDPVDLYAARGAVQDELAEAPFEFGLGLQEFEPQHLGRDSTA